MNEELLRRLADLERRLATLETHDAPIYPLPITDGGTGATDVASARTNLGVAAASHSHTITDLPVATDGEISATELVRADDSRLSNARIPTTHNHTIVDLPVANSGVSSPTQIVRADDARLRVGAGCRVRRTTDQTVPHATGTSLSFSETVYSFGGAFWSAATPTRVTIPITGRYAIVAAVHYAANSVGYRAVLIFVSETRVAEYTGPAVSADTVLTVSTVWNCVVGDYIEVLLFHDAGVSLAARAEGHRGLWLAVERVG